jgi:leucyl-tRNA synthetase
VLGRAFSIHNQPWPKYNSKLAEESLKTVVIQVNGKLRGQLTADSEQSKSKKTVEQMAKNDAKVFGWIQKSRIKKVIFVPGKLINFVIET